MKKLFTLLVLVIALFACLTGCKKNEEEKSGLEGIKIGFITLHDDSSTYDKNFLDAIKNVAKDLGLKDDQLIIRVNIPEGPECYDTACDLVDKGCNIIFADSFGHEAHMLKAAKEFPNVQFCHATGTTAHTSNVANFHNAFASIYEGRFLAGVAAGMKLNEMIEQGKITAAQAIMGYVGAFPYAEVKSGSQQKQFAVNFICKFLQILNIGTNLGAFLQKNISYACTNKDHRQIKHSVRHRIGS